MSAADLFHEWTVASGHPKTVSILARYGVTDTEIALACGLVRAVTTTEKFYEPHDTGGFLIVVPVAADGELHDLVAFDPRDPDRWWWRLGGEYVLGAGALSDQLLGQPLHVYRSPLSWLQSGGDGIVPLDFKRAAIDLVTAQNGIVAEDDTHVAELHRALTAATQWRFPDIYLMRREAAE